MVTKQKMKDVTRTVVRRCAGTALQAPQVLGRATLRFALEAMRPLHTHLPKRRSASTTRRNSRGATGAAATATSPTKQTRSADTASTSTGRPTSFATRALLTLVCFASCAIMLTLLVHMGVNEPLLGYTPARISIAIERGAPVEVTGRDLAAVGAGGARLGIETMRPAAAAPAVAAAPPRWRVRSLSAQGGERIAVRREGEREWQDVRVLELQSGMTLAIAQQRFRVDIEADGALVLLAPSGERLRYDGARLQRADSGPAGCPRSNLPQRAITLWNAWIGKALSVLSVDQALVFGGSVACGLRVPIDGKVGRSVRIDRSEGGHGSAPRYLLRALTGEGLRMVRSQRPAVGATGGSTGAALAAPSWLPLADAANEVAAGDRLLLGRTAYRVDMSAASGGNLLTLVPLGRTDKLTENATPTHRAVAWTVVPAPGMWQLPRSLRLGGVVLAAVMVIWLALAAWRLVANRRLSATLRIQRWFNLLANATLALAVVLAVGGRVYGLAVGVAWPLALLTALMLAASVWAVRGMHWPLALTLLLLALGVTVQSELGLAALHTAGMLQTHTLACFSALALALGMLAARVVPQLINRIQPWWRGRVLDVGIWALALAALTLLAMQVLHGNELGVWGLQPVELAKLALIGATAQLLALRLRWLVGGYTTPAWQVWLRLLPALALLLALIAISLWLLDDFSPFVLLGFWALGTLLVYSVARGQVALAGVGALATLACGAWVMTHATTVLELLQHFDLYGDRLRVWAHPELHPFTGEQLGRARALAAEGGNWGQLGEALAPMGVWRIPAVLDDFAPSVAVLLFGNQGATLLWLTQAALVLALLANSLQHARRARAIAGDYTAVHWQHFLMVASASGAFVLLGHFVVSWGTNTGLTPVMGQPMPFISAAGSHLLLLVWPVVLLAAAGTGPSPARSSAGSDNG